MEADLTAGVSFVMPVRNGARTLAAALQAIVAEAGQYPFEILVVDDNSTDDSRGVAERFTSASAIRLLQGEGRGAASAINRGIRVARFELIAQIDQDVEIQPGWLRALAAALDEAPDIGAAQGYYQSDPNGTFWARSMGLDLQERYSRIRRPYVDHVCTGNSLYRRSALLKVGLFDEALGYGYDNDLSYRLGQAGYRLAFRPGATSIHHWRTTLGGYLRQQYGVAFGRLDVIAKHPDRVAGDDVSGLRMILHPPIFLAGVVSLAWGCASLGRGGGPGFALGFGLFATLAIERLWAGISAAARLGEPLGLLWCVLHLMRDLAWICALVSWCVLRIALRPTTPFDSMRG